MTLTLKADAYTLQAIIDAGVPPDVAMTLLVSGPNAVPERALLSVHGRQRTQAPVSAYIWGPDAMVLLADRERAS
jgi:hypothetical protein